MISLLLKLLLQHFYYCCYCFYYFSFTAFPEEKNSCYFFKFSALLAKLTLFSVRLFRKA